MSSQSALSVLVELRADQCSDIAGIRESLDRSGVLDIAGFELDHDYDPVCMSAGGNEQSTVDNTIIVRGWLDSPAVEQELKQHDAVVYVWADTPIAPFNGNADNSENTDTE